MIKEAVRKQINTKFGTLSKFAKLSGYNRYELQKIFARVSPDKNILSTISLLCKRTANKPAPGEITEAQLLKLSRALKKAGGVYKFSREYPAFAEKSLYQILSGKRKRITGKVQKLFDHFKI